MTECEVCTSPASHTVTWSEPEVQTFTVCSDHAAHAVQNGAVVTTL